MQRKGPLPGKIFAWCILQRRFAGHFEYMESISCQNQLILDAWRRYLATKGRFYRLRLLQECIRVIFCQECGLSPAWSALRGCFIQRMCLHLPEMGLEKVPSRNAPLRYPKMHFEDASPRAFRLCRRRGDDYCRVQPTSVCPFGVVGLWAMLCCGVSGVGVAVDTNGGGAGGA